MRSSSGSARSSACEPLARRAGRAASARPASGSRRRSSAAAAPGAARSTSSLRPKRRIVTWNGCGRPSGRSAIASPSRISSRAGSARDRLDDLGHGAGHVVELAREDAHLVAALVDLDARAVELPLERRLAEPRERLGDVLGGLRQHRLHRPEQLDRKPREPGRALAERRLRPRPRDRPPASPRGALARPAARPPGDRLDHHPLERALAQLADQQAQQKVLLGLGRPPEQLPQQAAAARPPHPCP